MTLGLPRKAHSAVVTAKSVLTKPQGILVRLCADYSYVEIRVIGSEGSPGQPIPLHIKGRPEGGLAATPKRASKSNLHAQEVDRATHRPAPRFCLSHSCRAIPLPPQFLCVDSGRRKRACVVDERAQLR